MPSQFVLPNQVGKLYSIFFSGQCKNYFNSQRLSLPPITGKPLVPLMISMGSKVKVHISPQHMYRESGPSNNKAADFSLKMGNEIFSNLTVTRNCS